MKILLLISLTLISIFNPAVIYSQQNAAEFFTSEKDILELQDNRTLGEDNKLLKYLHSVDPEIRELAIYALANIGDSAVIDQLNFLLAGPFEDYPKKEDFIAATFMLGQIPSQKSEEMISFLLNNLPENAEEKILMFSYAADAIGKTGNENDLNNLCSIYSLNKINDTVLTRAVSMSFAKFALRKIKNEKSVETLKSILKSSSDTITVRNCAFAFWRIGDKKLLEKAAEEIYQLAESNDPQTRMWAFNALGKLKNELFLLYTLESFNSEEDWRVKVNMLNSFLNYELDSLSDLTNHLYSVIGDGIGDENEHVSLTSINVFGKMFVDLNNSKNTEAKKLSKDVLKNFKLALDSSASLNLSGRIQSELTNSIALIFKDEVKNYLLNKFSESDSYDHKAGIIRSFSNFDDGMIYKEVRDSISKEVQRYNLKYPNTSGVMIGSADLAKLYRAFVEMLTELDDKVDKENQNIIRLIYSEFVGSKDIILTDLALTGLKDSLYTSYSGETNSVILFDYNELEFPKDLDVMLILIDAMGELRNENAVSVLESNKNSDNYELAMTSNIALEKITGNKYDLFTRPRTDFDWQYLGSLSQKKFITLKTNKGDIKIELFPEVAPFTVMNFLKLSESNYYDNTVFHRVVSNFVIQGGDPTGSGYGGPGYSIRSEFSPLNYDTGMIGMASSGKDTEGSQFFITHSATPHLDGRYTLFGKVTEGMSVVNNIMIGDTITDIEVNTQID